jgi:hypothetical protein
MCLTWHTPTQQVYTNIRMSSVVTIQTDFAQDISQQLGHGVVYIYTEQKECERFEQHRYIL